LSYAEDAIKHSWRLAIAEQHRVTSRQMWSDDRDFDDVIAAHRSRDTTVERSSQLLHRRPTGNSMAAGALSGRDARTCLANIVLLGCLVLLGRIARMHAVH